MQTNFDNKLSIEIEIITLKDFKIIRFKEPEAKD